MASERQHQVTCERAHAVLAELMALHLSPTPENFRIWYVHLAGQDAALSRALDQIRTAGERLDDSVCADLYERFFVRLDEERALLTAGKRLNDLALELSHEVAAFGDETLRFGTSLHEAQERASHSPTGDRIRSRVMVEETRRMQEQASSVEGSLRERIAEIDTLRRDLQVERARTG